MTTHRFEISSIHDLNRENISSDIIPLINIESHATSINEINRPSTGFFSNVLHRIKRNSSAVNLTRKVDTNNLTVGDEFNEIDSYPSSIHSTNKFLDELRLKRRELLEKTKHLSIEQRIALIRHHHERNLRRAEDIFAVNFELDDNDVLNDDSQETIRNSIFHELNRQRIKQFHKDHRHLIYGRALLLIIVSFLVFMSITLIYVVIQLYDRAKDFDVQLPDEDFIEMSYDKAMND